MEKILINDPATLAHYGVLERSGRYPWGSGEDPYQRLKSFNDMRKKLKSKGMDDETMSKAMGFETVQELRSYISYANNHMKLDNITKARKLRDRGWSNKAIAKELGMGGESSVRALLKPDADKAAKQYTDAYNMLKDQIDAGKYVDVSRGVEAQMGVTEDTKKKIMKNLEMIEGYNNYSDVYIKRADGNTTTINVMTPPGVEKKEVVTNLGKIKQFAGDIDVYLNNESSLGVLPPKQVDKNRIHIVYGDEGGAEKDGLVHIRPGVKDLSMGGNELAQVRIAAGPDHYIKGMAIYSDDIPKGKDIVVFTPKNRDTPVYGDKKSSILKPTKDDDNPFGSVVRQLTNEDGTEVTSAINIVNDDSSWSTWSKNLSSQFLSKQNVELARNQLGITRASKEAQLDEIMSLENNAVKRHFLNKFADEANGAARHLQAAALPRQATQVIMPVPELKDNEVFAPNFEHGETIALIRHPHASTTEIPVLINNTKNKAAVKLLGHSPANAIGINANVAEQLSGADFDGDTVIAIPDNAGRIKAGKPFKGMEGFDAKREYPYRNGMKEMTKKGTQTEMGKISNLITDMSIQGANEDEMVRAMKHSQVVIDAEKHRLDYKRSEKENRIADLRARYQVDPNNPDKRPGGATTVVSRSRSEVAVPKRRLARVGEGGPLDEEGNKRYTVVPDDELYYVDKKGRTKMREMRVPRMDEVRDAHELSTGTPIEKVYADHANAMKVLERKARLEESKTPLHKYSPAAAKEYKEERAQIADSIRKAEANAPRERHAQRYANDIVAAKMADNPVMTYDEKKKVRGQAINTARSRLGVKKPDITPTEEQWEAVQAGAVSDSMIGRILANSDDKKLKELAMPKETKAMRQSQVARMKAMYANGYTQAEIASIMGISASTVSKHLS